MFLEPERKVRDGNPGEKDNFSLTPFVLYLEQILVTKDRLTREKGFSNACRASYQAEASMKSNSKWWLETPLIKHVTKEGICREMIGLKEAVLAPRGRKLWENKYVGGN